VRKTIDDPDTLEPCLTKADKAVLAAVTACGPDEWAKRELGMAATVWQIAETLDTNDLADLGRTLNGLQHLGYVCRAHSRARKRWVYWRTRKGDEVLS
jgi:hypothetical protein